MQNSANPPVAQSEGEAFATIGKQPSLSRLFVQYQISEKGLSTQEARKRLGQYGPNEPTAVRRTARLQQLLVFVANLLVLILLVTSIITAVLVEVVNRWLMRRLR